MKQQLEDPLDVVRRALIAAEVRVVSERTRIPEGVVMALAQAHGWNVEAAEASIESAMKDVADNIVKTSEAAILFGGNPGGGKSLYAKDAADALRYRISNYGAEVVAPRNLGVVTCVS